MTSIATQESARTDAGGEQSGPAARAAITTPLFTQAVAPVRNSWGALAALVVLGGISNVAYYFGFVQPYLLSEYYRRPLLDLAKINGHTAASANEWALTWIVLFICYYLAFRLCPPATHVSRVFKWVGLAIITGWAAVFSISMIFMYPVGAADIFDQIFRARLLTEYGLNPFTTLPSSIAGDPFQPFVAWRGDASPYGPVWETLAGGASWLGGDSLWNNLILFKLLVVVAYGVSVALTYGILRAHKPDWALRGTLFFAWNPLVIFEVAGNGHNDAIVVTFLLAAVYLFVLAKRWAVLPALMAGALTKFVPVLLVPVAAAAIWRDRVRVGRHSSTEEYEGGPPRSHVSLSSFEAFYNLAIGGVIALGLAVVLYAPFWTGFQSIGALGRQSLFTASIPKVALDVLINDLGMQSVREQALAESIVRTAALALVGVVTLGLALWVFRQRNANTMRARQALVGRTLVAFYEIIFVYLAFAALWFQPWYLLWLVALTAPVARLVNVHRTLLFCIGGVANYFVWDYIWLWNRTGFREIQITSALVVYTLPLFYTAYTWLRPLMSKAESDPESGGYMPAPHRSSQSFS
ncbi:MAG TPA: hypothetical protein VEX13_04840 [Chloroflexia bacterium]|nr:hypothetical protein [Chloroflexia bacterium]